MLGKPLVLVTLYRGLQLVLSKTNRNGDIFGVATPIFLNPGPPTNLGLQVTTSSSFKNRSLKSLVTNT